jgi:hypothetical protein
MGSIRSKVPSSDTRSAKLTGISKDHKPDDVTFTSSGPRARPSNGAETERQMQIALSMTLPPKSRHRPRADGGVDETTRVDFVRPLSPAQVRLITLQVFNVVEENHERAGLVALTKIEFIEPDTCELRIWCRNASRDEINERVKVMLGLIHLIDRISMVASIDGISRDAFDLGPAR